MLDLVENNMIVNDYYPESYYISGLDLDENWSDFKSFHENIDRLSCTIIYTTLGTWCYTFKVN